MPSTTYIQAITEAIREEMVRDSRVFLMGEDVQLGGAFGMTGLVEQFGKERVRNTPISEAGFVGAAIGAAMMGWRPIVDLGFASFAYCAMDQLCNQAAKWRYMSGGQVTLPIVYRMANGSFGGAAAQHSSSLYSQFMQVPGFKIAVPSTPHDVKGILKAAIRDPNPVLVFEPGRLIGMKGEVPTEDYVLPFGKCVVRREGTDVTIVAIGSMVPEAMGSADSLATQNISAEVVDPRTLVPLDTEGIIRSVKKTHRLVVVDESTPACSAASEIIACVAEQAIEFIDAPMQRLCSAGVPMPFSPVLENAVLPNASRIADAVHSMLRN